MSFFDVPMNLIKCPIGHNRMNFNEMHAQLCPVLGRNDLIPRPAMYSLLKLFSS